MVTFWENLTLKWWTKWLFCLVVEQWKRNISMPVCVIKEGWKLQCNCERKVGVITIWSAQWIKHCSSYKALFYNQNVFNCIRRLWRKSLRTDHQVGYKFTHTYTIKCKDRSAKCMGQGIAYKFRCFCTPRDTLYKLYYWQLEWFSLLLDL